MPVRTAAVSKHISFTLTGTQVFSSFPDDSGEPRARVRDIADSRAELDAARDGKTRTIRLPDRLHPQGCIG